MTTRGWTPPPRVSSPCCGRRRDPRSPSFSCPRPVLPAFSCTIGVVKRLAARQYERSRAAVRAAGVGWGQPRSPTEELVAVGPGLVAPLVATAPLQLGYEELDDVL